MCTIYIWYTAALNNSSNNLNSNIITTPERLGYAFVGCPSTHSCGQNRGQTPAPFSPKLGIALDLDELWNWLIFGPPRSKGLGATCEFVFLMKSTGPCPPYNVIWLFYLFLVVTIAKYMYIDIAAVWRNTLHTCTSRLCDVIHCIHVHVHRGYVT